MRSPSDQYEYRCASDLRPSDADPILADDDETPRQSVEVMVGDETSQDIQHRTRLLITETEYDHPWMRSGRIDKKVAESDAESDKHPLLVPAYGEKIGIGRPDEILVANRVHVVAMLDQHRANSDGDVLIELDPHEPTDSEWISCLANHAPYAAAARTSSEVSDG